MAFSESYLTTTLFEIVNSVNWTLSYKKSATVELWLAEE